MSMYLTLSIKVATCVSWYPTKYDTITNLVDRRIFTKVWDQRIKEFSKIDTLLTRLSIAETTKLLTEKQLETLRKKTAFEICILEKALETDKLAFSS